LGSVPEKSNAFFLLKAISPKHKKKQASKLSQMHVIDMDGNKE